MGIHSEACQAARAGVRPCARQQARRAVRLRKWKACSSPRRLPAAGQGMSLRGHQRPHQLWAGMNRQSGMGKLKSSARKQIWMRPSRDGRMAKPRGTQIRRDPILTCVSPRVSVSTPSAGMQSRLEQQSAGYQECAWTGSAEAMARSAAAQIFRKLGIDFVPATTFMTGVGARGAEPEAQRRADIATPTASAPLQMIGIFLSFRPEDHMLF